MLDVIKEKNYLHPFIIWLMLLLWYLGFSNVFLTSPQDRLDNFVAEQSFWFFNKIPKEKEKIAVIAIDKTSRRLLNAKWPWKRGVTAKLIRNIASLSPKVIGLDIVFSGKSEEKDDKALISAFESHPNVVLGYVLHETSQEKPIKEFIDATSSLGFVNKPLQGGIVKELRTFLVHDEKEVAFSLEVEIFFSYLDLDKKQIRVNREGIFLKDAPLIPSPGGDNPPQLSGPSLKLNHHPRFLGFGEKSKPPRY